MNIPDKLRRLFFYRMHPEAAIRYAPIVKIIKQNHWQKNKILEIGSGSYGITPYLKQKVTGVDTSFDEPAYPLLKQVIGSGDRLPFKSNKFDVVILSDVLEHVSSKMRQKVLYESVRVATKAVIVSGPFGEKAALQDKELAKYSVKKIKQMHPFFEDHLRFGLPKVEDIKNYLRNNKKVKDIALVGEYLNLTVRGELMKLFITKNKLQFYFYLKGLMPFVGIFKRLNKKPGYRNVILVRVH